ncbi:MAG: hypothetical protein A3G93_12850 [Nitrospinae bacterium RIFCSPLOWO2_12_FULL_45_22]|nr:MAG: hypothetical protein A3G93_12850 [Nitrospinae bacterium RIFCSPLOWO2_12_FULL_45_22]
MPQGSNEALEAIYYPDCYPHDRNHFASMHLYFDRVHFVTLSDDASTVARYTQYLKGLPDKIQIGVMGDHSGPSAQKTIERTGKFYCFVLDIKPLLGDTVYYHPGLLTATVNDMVSKLTSGGLPVDEFAAFLMGKTPELEAVEEFTKAHPELDDDILVRVLPSARYLAIKNRWIAVSDEGALPVPDVRPLLRSAPDLAAAIGLELLSLHMPAVHWSTAEDLLEIRGRFSDELVPFRMMTLKLAAELRKLLGDKPDYSRVREEARFLVETTVMPYVAEIHRRIELEKGKLWRKIFGTALKWVSLGMASFADPTGALVLKAIEEAGKDMTKLLGSAHGITIAGDPGLSVLFKLTAGKPLQRKGRRTRACT